MTGCFRAEQSSDAGMSSVEDSGVVDAYPSEDASTAECSVGGIPLCTSDCPPCPTGTTCGRLMLCLSDRRGCFPGDPDVVPGCRGEAEVCAARRGFNGTCVPSDYCAVASELGATCFFSDGTTYEPLSPAMCPEWDGACQNGCGSCDEPVGWFEGDNVACHGTSRRRSYGVCGAQGKCTVGSEVNQRFPGQPSVCLVISNDGEFPEGRHGVMVYPETCLAYDAEFPEDVACFDQNGERID